MKHLKTYQLFEAEQTTDNEQIDIKDSPADNSGLDSQNQQTRDEAIKVLETQIKEYNTKKSQIDQIYLSNKSDEETQLDIQKILGRDLKKRNPFLVQYEQFAKDARLLARLQKAVVDDTAIIAKYQKQLQSINNLFRISTDTTEQAKLQTSIKTTTDTITKYQQNITDNKKNIPKLKQSVARKVDFINTIKLKIAQISKMKTEK